MAALSSVICLIFLVSIQSVESFYEEKEQEKHTTAKLNITICNSLRKHCGQSLDRTGIYGKHSILEDASGWLYKLSEDNEHGCESLSIAIDAKPWIALIRRGTCSFDKKIENAFNHNASGVIIFDKQDSKETFEMFNPGSTQAISISIKMSVGEHLVSLLNNKTLFVEILVGQVHSKWQMNPTSVLFVSVSFIVLMVISLAWLVFYYVQRFRYVHARDKTEKRLSSAAKKAIAKLPTRNISKKDEEDEVDSCPVCLDGYKAGDTIRILPCQHEYHKLCIDPWLVEHRTCPMCKLNILKELGVPAAAESQTNSRNIEVATVEPQDYEDHASAADNPVLYLGDVEPGSMQSSRRPSCGGESSGSSDSSGRVLHVSADVNWERDEQTSSTSNLVEPSTVRT